MQQWLGVAIPLTIFLIMIVGGAWGTFRYRRRIREFEQRYFSALKTHLLEHFQQAGAGAGFSANQLADQLSRAGHLNDPSDLEHPLQELIETGQLAISISPAGTTYRLPAPSDS